MQKTPIQEQIEANVTNGLGYVENSGYAMRRLDEALRLGSPRRDTELGLQMHLGVMEARTARNESTKRVLWRIVFDIGEIAHKLGEYGLQEHLITPADVEYALRQKYRPTREQEPTENLFYIGKDGRDYSNLESLIQANTDYMNQILPKKEKQLIA